MYKMSLFKHLPYRCVTEITIGEEDILCIVDTGCATTLVPSVIAKRYGKKLGYSKELLVGGKSYNAELYQLTNVKIGGLLIERLTVFSSSFSGSLKDHVLLGQNILNNLNYQVSRNSHSIIFNLEVWKLLADKEYPFTVYFKEDNRPYYYETLLDEKISG